ncbi:MAG TPA: YihY/virulence factor BrkB family protein [Gammaproteobacteria bacterium]|nr:YihY/virulence factor BrkB family protein [Gammaproteobacteria bacterium]
MSVSPHRIQQVLLDPLGFVRSVLSGFRANQGFLLAGAVAYYTLLSIVPLFALILVVLSQVIEPQRLLDITQGYLALVAPGKAPALMAQIEIFLVNWKLVGIVGLAVMLFFSSLAFTVLENAMSVIFHHRVTIRRRHFLISAVLPYFYMLLLTVGLLVVTVVSGGLDAMAKTGEPVFGFHWTLSGHGTTFMYIAGLLGEVLLLTSLYLVMPVGRLAWHHALAGGVTAALLWELTRHFLVWYFSTLSFVNVIYGTLATAVVILLSLEAAALILLLGAQVIASYERIGTTADDEGLRT